MRRLVTDDCEIFQRIVQKAIAITKNCNCNPSCYNCLRNYYNQAVHDILDRREAYMFLEAFKGDAIAILDDNFEEVREENSSDVVAENLLRFGASWPCDYNNWNELSQMMLPDNCRGYFEDFDYYHVPLPSNAYCKCKIYGTDYASEILMLWKNNKIMVFEDDKEKLEVPGWTSLKVGEIRAGSFAELF